MCIGNCLNETFIMLPNEGGKRGKGVGCDCVVMSRQD